MAVQPEGYFAQALTLPAIRYQEWVAGGEAPGYPISGDRTTMKLKGSSDA